MMVKLFRISRVLAIGLASLAFVTPGFSRDAQQAVEIERHVGQKQILQKPVVQVKGGGGGGPENENCLFQMTMTDLYQYELKSGDESIQCEVTTAELTIPTQEICMTSGGNQASVNGTVRYPGQPNILFSNEIHMGLTWHDGQDTTSVSGFIDYENLEGERERIRFRWKVARIPAVGAGECFTLKPEDLVPTTPVTISALSPVQNPDLPVQTTHTELAPQPEVTLAPVLATWVFSPDDIVTPLGTIYSPKITVWIPHQTVCHEADEPQPDGYDGIEPNMRLKFANVRLTYESSDFPIDPRALTVSELGEFFDGVQVMNNVENNISLWPNTPGDAAFGYLRFHFRMPNQSNYLAVPLYQFPVSLGTEIGDCRPLTFADLQIEGWPLPTFPSIADFTRGHFIFTNRVTQDLTYVAPKSLATIESDVFPGCCEDCITPGGGGHPWDLPTELINTDDILFLLDYLDIVTP